jgi:transcriptional regulator of nitric oxide reductase
MLCGILLLIHLQHSRLVTRHRLQPLADVELSKVQSVYSDAAGWGEVDERGGRQVISADGKILGCVIQTAPASDHFLGFSGPSNLLIALDTQDRIVEIQILESRDTRDHVELIRKNHAFLDSWKGLTWSEAASRRDYDVVSGATLTSYAMLQGLQSRLGSTAISQKFPKLLELRDAQLFFPTAKHITKNEIVEGLWDVHDESSRIVGAILRTSPAADEIIGYQGPTETRLAIDSDGKIVAIAVMDSFDNEPYVGYVRGDAWFTKKLKQY